MAKEISQQKLRALLEAAGKKLGTDPETLRRALESGDAGSLLGPAHADEGLRRALSDPEAAKKLLGTPGAQALLKKLMEG